MSSSPEFNLSSGPVSALLVAPNLDADNDRRPIRLPAPDLCRRALSTPRGFPELGRCVVPGDNVIIAVDPETPFLADVLTAVCEHLQTVPDGGVSLTLLLPEDESGNSWQWLTDSLPLHLQQQMTIVSHLPSDQNQLSYLASSAAGERIYLNRLLTDADMIVSVGLLAFDGQLGVRGTTSVLFPAFSDEATLRAARSHGHSELTPEQQRPFRDLVDEIGWLLGTQFTVQVIPGVGVAPTEIIAGLPDDVLQHGREVLNRVFRILVSEEVDAVVLSIPGGAAFGWRQLGHALEQASHLINQGGRIIVVADLPVPEGPAATMLRRCQEPEDLLKPLRREPTSDAVEIAQLIETLRRARVYLLSTLPPDVVEEMGMIPIADSAELQRLVAAVENRIVIPNANYAWCEVDVRV